MIKPIGALLQTDDDGLIVPLDNEMQPEWQPVAQRYGELIMQTFADQVVAVYVRGSIAKGTAIKEVSDIDGLLLTNVPAEEVDWSAADTATDQLLREFPFVTDIEYGRQSLRQTLEAADRNWVSFVLATQTQFVVGDDIRSQLPRYRPGDRATYAHLIKLDKPLARVRRELTAGDTHSCSWVMKRIVRSGFELVMKRDQSFTRDLYPCWEIFSQYYPEYEARMRTALELAVEPTDDPDAITAVLDDIGEFVLRERDKLVKAGQI